MTERTDYSALNGDLCTRCHRVPPDPTVLTNLCQRCGAISLLLDIARLTQLTEAEARTLERLQAEDNPT